MNYSGAYLRDPLGKNFNDLCYRPLIYDPDLWMRPVFKSCGYMYYEYILCYINNFTCIIDELIHTMSGTEEKLKLKE